MISGFLVFLIALPLCLGISMASGVPPTSGLITAIVGGMLVSFLGSARLTIKGPAAGLIVIAIGCVTELGAGDNLAGYHRLLAVGVVAGLLQVLLALTKSGVIGDMMPASVVHGMLAAIGVIIISKQTHTALGVVPHGKGPLRLLAEIPHSLMNMNPDVFFIGAISLMILFGLPMVNISWVRKIPGPMVVLAVAIPLGLYLDLAHEHNYVLANHSYHLGPNFLIRLPASLLNAIAFPDFSIITSLGSIKYIIMFTLVGMIESLLSVTAVDSLDPERRPSDLNSDLMAVGIGNTVAAALGGLPMISEIVRSKANIDNGAESSWSNFFHGTFLLLSIALMPSVLQQIPLAALAAMLIYTGFRLASPKEFSHVYHIGKEQFALLVTTMMVTLATDLLIGVATGLVLKVLIHLKNGATVRSLFKAIVKEHRDRDTLTLTVHEAAIFSNYLGLKKRLDSIDSSVRRVVVDFDNCWVVDHTVLAKLQSLERTWKDRELLLTGFDGHLPLSHHELADRRKARILVQEG
jgi:MFS superfamily sulfate permease-like transporter